MLYANATLMIAAPVIWDKYALPLLASLWLLKSAEQLDVEGDKVSGNRSLQKNAGP
jgi:hypothetical protein